VAELHCVGDALALGVHVDKLEAPIRVQGGSNVESLLCSKVPRQPCDRFGMDEDPITNRPERLLVEVKRPWKYSQALIRGLRVDRQRRLRVSSACGRSKSQRYGGNTVSTPARIDRKWLLNVRMARSARFLQCMSGGTSWNLAFHLTVMASLFAALASLSRI
jgi:hypothetical protein